MELQFDSPPTSYSGFYFDYTGKVASRVHGTRLSDRTVEEYGGFKSASDKREFLVAQNRDTTPSVKQ